MKEYLAIFGISVNDFLTIAFEETAKIVLITKKDMTKIKYELSDTIETWNILRTNLPEELEFIGFQHSAEGNVFSAYTTLDYKKG